MNPTANCEETGALFLNSPPTAHRFIETCDPQVVSDRFAREFAPHQLEVTARSGAFHTVAHKMPFSHAMIYHTACTADVQIITKSVGDNYIFYLPLHGRISILRKYSTVDIAPGEIGVINPNEQYCLRKLDNNQQITLKFRRQDIESQATELYGGTRTGGLEFKVDQPARLADCPLLARMIDALYHDMLSPDSRLSGEAYLAPMETLLARLLLRDMPSTIMHDALSPKFGSGPAPYYVVRVEKAIAGDASRNWTIEDMVRISTVSARSLYAGFRKFRGISPMRHLKNVRLERVRSELISQRNGGGIHVRLTDVAYAWGFRHMSDFSMSYRERFGERPSDTMRVNAS